jgi:ribosome-binding factor A
MPRRVERLGEQFKREIAQLLRSSVRDPRVLGVTVTGAEVSRDLTFARVWVHIGGDEEQRVAALEGLAAASPFIRRQLSDLLSIRRVPELGFKEDRTLEHARRIDDLLREAGPIPPAPVEEEDVEVADEDEDEEEDEA